MEDVPEAFLADDTSGQSMAAQQHLLKALTLLQSRDRQILWLAHAESYSHQEIAEIMGLATASVRVLLFRARRRMRHLLEGSR